MSVSTLFDVNNKAYQAKSVRVYDLYVDGTAYGITGGSIQPGPPNTFFRTDNFQQVVWDPFTLSYIPIGPTGTILRSGVTGGTSGIHWGNIQLQDIPQGVPGYVLTSTNGSAPSWQPILISSLTPGLSNQILHTKSDGSAAEWTSDLTVPGSSTFTGNGLFQTGLAVTNDLNVINGDLAVGNGSLSVLVGPSIVQNLDIGGQLSCNSDLGSPGFYLTQSGTGPQWTHLVIPSNTPGLANQVFVTDGTGSASMWSSNLALPGTLNVSGTSNLIGALTTNNGSILQGTTNIINNLQFNSVSGSSGQYLKKTGASTQAWNFIAPADINPGSNNQALFTRSGNVQFSTIIPSDISTGTANQLLVKDISGTSTIFTSNPTIPGTLTVNSTTNLLGNLQLASSSGSSGQYIKKTSGSTQTWANIAVSDLTAGTTGQSLWMVGSTPTWSSRSFRYGYCDANFTSTDWNSNTTNILGFTGFTGSSFNYGTNNFNNLTVNAPNISLIANYSGNYLFSMYCCLTNGGAGTSSIRFNVIVNGSIVGGGPVVTITSGSVGCISCSFRIPLNNADLIAFETNRISGTDSLTSDSTNSNFTFQFLDTLA